MAGLVSGGQPVIAAAVAAPPPPAAVVAQPLVMGVGAGAVAGAGAGGASVAAPVLALPRSIGGLVIGRRTAESVALANAAASSALAAVVAPHPPGVIPVPGVPPNVSKILREVYVGGLVPGPNTTTTALKDFFNTVMQQLNLTLRPGPPVLNVRLGDTGIFAFLEFRHPDETDLVLQLNNIAFFGVNLRIVRPRGYIVAYGDRSAGAVVAELTGSTTTPSMPDALASMGLAGGSLFNAAAAPPPPPPALVVKNFPPSTAVAAISEVFNAFGTVASAAALAPDSAIVIFSALSSGLDLPTIVEAMKGFEFGGSPLVIEVASAALVAEHTRPKQQAPPALPSSTAAPSGAAVHTNTVLELSNMLAAADAADANEVADVCADLTEILSTHGAVVRVVVPDVKQRAALALAPDAPTVPVFAELSTPAAADAAAAAMRTKKFDGRPVVVRAISADALNTILRA